MGLYSTIFVGDLLFELCLMHSDYQSLDVPLLIPIFPHHARQPSNRRFRDPHHQKTLGYPSHLLVMLLTGTT
jgi:hypothetical protein